MLGALPELLKDPLTLLERAAKVAAVVDLRFPNEVVQAIASPPLIEAVLVSEVKTFTKQSLSYVQLRQVLGNGLITSVGAQWRRQRRLVQPAFHRDRIASFATRMVTVAQQCLGAWKPGVTFDVTDAFGALTLRVLCETLLPDLGEGGEVLIRGLTALQHLAHPLQAELSAAQRDELSRTSAGLDELLFAVIAARRAGQGPADDLLAVLIAAVDEETGEPMSDAQLRDELVTLFLAGHETTAALLSWTVYFLSQAPELEHAVRREVAEALEGRPAGLGDLPRLGLLTRVLRESLRLAPPIWLMTRRVEEEIVIDGWRFPRQSSVLLSPAVVQRLPDVWADPDRFDPERFRDVEAGVASEPKGMPRGAYFPFSLGPRRCLGDTFAMLEAQLVLATVMQAAPLTMAPGAQVTREALVTLRPRGLLMSPAPSR